MLDDRISVIVRAYNEAEHLPVLIHGLRRQTIEPKEIIVVDSGSTDGTPEVATTLGCIVVTIDKTEFSFGKALNVGFATATGSLALVMSAHVRPVYDDFVSWMLKPFDRRDVAVAYGRQIGDHRTKFSEARIMSRWFPETSIWDQGHPFSNNANAMIRIDEWHKHAYDETLTGLEDLAFARAAIDAGQSVAYVAEAPVVHVHEETWSTVLNRYRREAVAYRQIYTESRMTIVRAVSLAVANSISDYAHAIASKRLSGNITGIPLFRAAQFTGAWQGFNQRTTPDSRLLRRFYYPADEARSATTGAGGSRIDYEEFGAR